MEECWTILSVLQWTAGFFSRKGIDQPRANAEVLLASMLGVDRIQLYLQHDKPLTADELSSYRDLVRRRGLHEPTQYITGRQEFWSLDFEVNPSVLIPRPETELLVEHAIAITGQRQVSILDLGTGSGAIAVSVSRECRQARVFATDRSPSALVTARRNAFHHDVASLITFIAMNLLDAFARINPLFDLIISNPPYIGDTDLPGLPPEIREHEPVSALAGGGALGLDIPLQILDDALFYLRPCGTLLMEIGYGQADVLREKLARDTRIGKFEFIRDYSGINRMLKVQIADG